MREAVVARRLRLTGNVVVALALSACAPTAGAPAPQRTGAAGSGRTGSAHAGATSATCTRARKVAIVKRATAGGQRFAFSPDTLTIQRGSFLAVTNRSGRVHELVAEPDAGLVTSVLDVDERQVIQFPETGSFTVQSAGTTHRAVLHLKVSGDSGCETPEPTLTVTGARTVNPAHLSVAATQNFTVVNESATARTVTCSPDPGGNGDNNRVDPGETQILAIDKPGRYKCLEATVTVTGK
ncbi:hypothetical protein [Actinoplanes sp. NPDC049316]|uniref:cupredoxin domain-containing protein n=1 Tax=Actinoplanes sp. NPDC049316 TaxID=3154727 RepID=UPI00342B2D8F